MKIYVDKMPKATGQGVENQEELEIRMIFDSNKTADIELIHDHDRELVAKVLGMVRENLKEELLLTKNENQEEAKLKLVKIYSIDLDVLNKIEKEILNGYTKI